MGLSTHDEDLLRVPFVLARRFSLQLANPESTASRTWSFEVVHAAFTFNQFATRGSDYRKDRPWVGALQHLCLGLDRRPQTKLMLRLAVRNGGSLVQARRRMLCAAAEGAGGNSAVLSPRVSALVDELVSLNMLEVKSLTDELKDRLGIDDAALGMGGGMPMMNPAMMAAMNAGAGAGDSGAEEEKVEKTSFDLKLEGYDAAKKIAVIKEIRTITGLGLKEAKAMVDEAPKVFKTAVAKEEAEEIASKLKEIGGNVSLE